MADATGGEVWARRLLRQAERGLRWRVVPGMAGRAEEAERRLRDAALRGDMAALRALAGPGPRPDPRFTLIWSELVWVRRDAVDALRELLYRRNSGRAGAGPGARVTDDLALLVLYPDEDELTDDMRRVVAVAAALSGHPLATIARRKILAVRDRDVVDDVCDLVGVVPELADFCVRNELAPSRPERRALFWLLTGRPARYRAADPDGAQALRAYAAGNGAARARLRKAAIAGGLFGLLRRMTEAHGEFGDLLGEEPFAELAVALVRHERLGLLWELITQLSPADAVRQVRRFPGDWRPRAATDARLYAALRSAPLDAVAAAAADPGLVTTIRTGNDLLHVGYGRSLVAILSRPAGQQPCSLDVYGLPGGELLGHHEYRSATLPVLAVPYRQHRADGADGDSSRPPAVIVGDWRGLWRFTRGERVLLDEGPVQNMAATLGGWVALTAAHLLIGAGAGRPEQRVPLADLGLRPGAGLLAVSADGTRLAAADDRRIVLLDAGGRLLGATTLHETDPERTTPARSLGFLGDAVISAHRGWSEERIRKVDSNHDQIFARDKVEVTVHWHLVRWSPTPDGRLVRTGYGGAGGATERSEEPVPVPDWASIHPAPVWGRGPQRMRRDHLNPGSGYPPPSAQQHLTLHELPAYPGRLLLIGVEGTTRLIGFGATHRDTRTGIGAGHGSRPYGVPGTSLLAIRTAGGRELRVHDVRRGDVLPSLNRPLPRLRRADLDAVRALRDHADDPAVRVLHACLEHRWPDH